MHAKITNPKRSGKVASNRKEDRFYQEYAAILPTRRQGGYEHESFPFVTLRLYHTQSRAYACVWAHTADWTITVSGGGRAGGYGYHRGSAAAQAAITNAGIALSEDIAGVGDSAIRAAVIAIAKELCGGREFFIHVAHG